MKKKVVKLNEKSLEALVKKIIKEDVGLLNPDSFMGWVETLEPMEQDDIRRVILLWGVKVGGRELKNYSARIHYDDQVNKIISKYLGRGDTSYHTDISDEDKKSFKMALVDAYNKGVPSLREDTLEDLVKNILKEEQLELDFGGHTEDEMNDVWEKLNDTIGVNPKYDDLMDAAFSNEPSISIESFINQLPTHMGYEREYLVSVLEQIKEEGI